ncbi:hypothetical protein OESDEN_04158 [Oesophagostomum dentatum]|uniref:P-type domain-containing protein n=1 Tax=Oesophagostomum dentatum TaxID=61180 RepID=A0A0B1TJ81_OESDE|nr:hypothetical protein OESDEN_04158 [Oesophagostomum dentatum]
MFLPFLLLLCGLVRSDVVRMNCHPEPGATKEKCEDRDCIWDPQSTPAGVPPCYLRSGMGYRLDSTTGDTFTLIKNDGPRNPWANETHTIFLSKRYYGKALNVKIFTPGRYEPPIDLPRGVSESFEELEFATQTVNGTFVFTVTRQSTRTRLFDTSIGGLIFCDKFLQIATTLPSDAMYGWGENVHPTLKHNFNRYTTWAMHARDEPPSSDGLQTKNLYGETMYY